MFLFGLWVILRGINESIIHFDERAGKNPSFSIDYGKKNPSYLGMYLPATMDFLIVEVEGNGLRGDFPDCAKGKE